jgi:hypothetical protein
MPWKPVTRDEAAGPITGTTIPVDSVFDIPQGDGTAPVRITGFGSFVTTQAAGYCFLPNITALCFFAGLT